MKSHRIGSSKEFQFDVLQGSGILFKMFDVKKSYMNRHVDAFSKHSQLLIFGPKAFAC